jgi:hypothetical protein
MLCTKESVAIGAVPAERAIGRLVRTPGALHTRLIGA